MGHTGGPIRRPEPAAECPAMTTLRDTYYRPLVRLAALLTGDVALAETVACEALAALRSRPAISATQSEDVVRYLQHQVLLRSRRNRRTHAAKAPGHGGQWPARRGRPSPSAAGRGGPPQPSLEFGGLAVVLALQDLPRREREAVVLTHYLDLAEQQAAAVAGITEAALRHRLDKAMRTLQVRLPRG